MKKIIGLMMIAAGLWSCSNPEKKIVQADADPTQHPDYQKGFDLVANSDCYTCHKISDKLVGPAYVEVANRYANQKDAVDTLVQSIIYGSIGKWGQMQMTPHANLSKEEATAMAKYILTLKQ